MFSYAFPAAAGFAPAAIPPANQLQEILQAVAQLQAQMAQQQAGTAQLRAELQAELQVVQEEQAQLLARLEQQRGVQEQLQAGLAQLQAKQGNVRRRTQNWRAQQTDSGPAPSLAPLVKEQLPPAGAAAVGTLPPEGTFPAIWPAVFQVGARRLCCMCTTGGCTTQRCHLSTLLALLFLQLTHAQLDALEEFYGEQFGDRRAGGCFVLLCRAGEPAQNSFGHHPL